MSFAVGQHSFFNGVLFRMSSKKDAQLEQSAKQIEKQIHLIDTPALETKAKLAKHAFKVASTKQQIKMELA